MKLLKFVVVSNAKSIGLFPVMIDGRIFSGWRFENGMPIPCFGDNPVLFRITHAQFLARELRRAGYFVSSRPYFLFMLRDAVMCLRVRLLQRRAVKAPWRK